MKLVLYFLGLLLLLTTQQSCKLLNPEEPIPAYIYIDTCYLSTSTTTEGSASHKITDVWMYVKGDFWGVYELPAYIPYFTTDSTQIVMRPGIKDNGISTTRKPYPFYTATIKNINPSPLHTDTFSLQTKYLNDVVFLANENFESGNLFEKYTGDTTLIITSDAADVFEGNRSAKLIVDTARSLGQIATLSNYSVGTNYTEVYVELNYKSNIDFKLFLLAYNGNSYVPYEKLQITKKSMWSKIYINIGPDITATQATSFKIMLQSSLPSGTTQGTVLFDNFKILYR